MEPLLSDDSATVMRKLGLIAEYLDKNRGVKTTRIVVA
jgi:hypothetical protein